MRLCLRTEIEIICKDLYMSLRMRKGVLFDTLCQSSKVGDLAKLRELVLVGDFKKHLPERRVTYLNGQKVASLIEAAALSDEVVLPQEKSKSKSSVICNWHKRSPSPLTCTSSHLWPSDNNILPQIIGDVVNSV